MSGNWGRLRNKSPMPAWKRCLGGRTGCLGPCRANEVFQATRKRPPFSPSAIRRPREAGSALSSERWTRPAADQERTARHAPAGGAAAAARVSARFMRDYKRARRERAMRGGRLEVRYVYGDPGIRFCRPGEGARSAASPAPASGASTVVRPVPRRNKNRIFQPKTAYGGPRRHI